MAEAAGTNVANGANGMAQKREMEAERNESRGHNGEAEEDARGKVEERDSEGYKTGERKKGVLRKLALHRVV